MRRSPLNSFGGTVAVLQGSWTLRPLLQEPVEVPRRLLLRLPGVLPEATEGAAEGAVRDPF